MSDLREHIRDIPDFPKKGIIFKDITPLLGDPAALAGTVDRLAHRHADDQVEVVAAIESRGFIFGGALAVRLGAGLVLIRKPGKLPYDTLSQTYTLEYGTDTLEMHSDAIAKGSRVLVFDDLLATGGTAGAAVDLVRQAGGRVVGASFVIELSFLGGRARLGDTPVSSLIQYE